MISHSITVIQPDTVEEAVAAWSAARDRGEVPAYLGGGTELVTQGREQKLQATVLIDTKRIPATQRLDTQRLDTDTAQGELVFGSALRLSHLREFPLLERCARGVADRSVRNSITLGGNICGMLAYREAVLPFLVLDGVAELAGPEGLRLVAMKDVFNKRMRLKEGEFVLSFRVSKDAAGGLDQGTSAAGHPGSAADSSYGAVQAGGAGKRGGWFYRRQTRDARVDYPLVTLAMVALDGQVRLATAGSWGYPLRPEQAEGELQQLFSSDGAASAADLRAAAEAALDAVDAEWKDDYRGSRTYRREVTVQAVAAGLEFLKERR